MALLKERQDQKRRFNWRRMTCLTDAINPMNWKTDLAMSKLGYVVIVLHGGKLLRMVEPMTTGLTSVAPM